MSQIRSFGELAIRRPLERFEDEYAAGQAEAKIIDPKPHRDRADLAALLSFVDDHGVLWDVMAMRYRDRGWAPVKVRCYKADGARSNTQPPGYELADEHLALIKRRALVVEPFPAEEPSEEEKRTRVAERSLIDHVLKPQEELDV